MRDTETSTDAVARKAQWASEVRSRLAGLRLSPAREAEIVDELSQHLEDRWRDLVTGGTVTDEAVRLALAEFRHRDVLTQHMAGLRQSHVRPATAPAAPTGSAFSDLIQDFRHAARVFWKQPGFAIAAVLTLALGIGATTAIFSVVYGVLLTPLPFTQSDRLVSVNHRLPSGESRNHGPDTYLTYRDNQRAFEVLGAWDRKERSITAPGEPERVNALAVTSTALAALRIQPALGRFFGTDDDVPGAPPRVILSHGSWQRRFAGAEDVIGQSLRIDGTSAEVIGVLPPSFKFLWINPEVLLQMPLERVNGVMFDFQVIGRLKPTTTVADANADVARMIPQLHPAFKKLDMQAHVVPLVEYARGDVAGLLWTLLAAVGVVLLIACANVANLFLIRTEGRQQELGVRAALGASRFRIGRVLLAESLVLAITSGAVGVALAYAAVGLLRAMAPAELPRVDEIGITLTVLLFAVTISVAVGLLFGVAPALRFGRPSPAVLREGRSSSDSPGRHRTRNALVVSEIALASVLMIVAGLLIRTVVLTVQVQPGFVRPEEVQTFRMSVPEDLVSDDQAFARILEDIEHRLQRIPGVVSVGIASSITMDGEDNGNSLIVEEFPVPEGMLSPLGASRVLGPATSRRWATGWWPAVPSPGRTSTPVDPWL